MDAKPPRPLDDPGDSPTDPADAAPLANKSFKEVGALARDKGDAASPRNGSMTKKPQTTLPPDRPDARTASKVESGENFDRSKFFETPQNEIPAEDMSDEEAFAEIAEIDRVERDAIDAFARKTNEELLRNDLRAGQILLALDKRKTTSSKLFIESMERKTKRKKGVIRDRMRLAKRWRNIHAEMLLAKTSHEAANGPDTYPWPRLQPALDLVKKARVSKQRTTPNMKEQIKQLNKDLVRKDALYEEEKALRIAKDVLYEKQKALLIAAEEELEEVYSENPTITRKARDRKAGSPPTSMPTIVVPPHEPSPDGRTILSAPRDLITDEEEALDLLPCHHTMWPMLVHPDLHTALWNRRTIRYGMHEVLGMFSKVVVLWDSDFPPPPPEPESPQTPPPAPEQKNSSPSDLPPRPQEAAALLPSPPPITEAQQRETPPAAWAARASKAALITNEDAAFTGAAAQPPPLSTPPPRPSDATLPPPPPSPEPPTQAPPPGPAAKRGRGRPRKVTAAAPAPAATTNTTQHQSAELLENDDLPGMIFDTDDQTVRFDDTDERWAVKAKYWKGCGLFFAHRNYMLAIDKNNIVVTLQDYVRKWDTNNDKNHAKITKIFKEILPQMVEANKA